MKQVCLDADDESEDSAAIYTDTEESIDEESEAEEETRQSAKSKKRKLTQSRLLSVEPTRRSPRKVSDLKVLYDMSVHPQDEFLAVTSEEEEIVPRKKSKRSKRLHVDDMDSRDGVAPSKPAHRKYADYVENSTSDEMEFDSGGAIPRIEMGTDCMQTSFSTFRVCQNRILTTYQLSRWLKARFHLQSQPIRKMISTAVTALTRCTCPREKDASVTTKMLGQSLQVNLLPSSTRSSRTH